MAFSRKYQPFAKRLARVIFIISTEKVEFKQLENWFVNQEDILKAIDNRISALIVKKTAIEADIEKQTAENCSNGSSS